MKTKLEELRAAFEATEGGMSGEDSDRIPTVDCRFYDLAHNLMPQLLEAVDKLKWITEFCAEHPEWFGEPNPLHGAENEWLYNSLEFLENLK